MPATTATAFLARPGLVDREAAAFGLLAIQGRDGDLRLLGAAHLDKAEPLRAAGVAIHDDLRRFDGPVRGEHLLQRATW